MTSMPSEGSMEESSTGSGRRPLLAALAEGPLAAAAGTAPAMSGSRPFQITRPLWLIAVLLGMVSSRLQGNGDQSVKEGRQFLLWTARTF